MKCIICKNGTTGAGKATVTLERESTTVVIKGVPADDKITARLLSTAEEAVRAGVQVDVRLFEAA